jgi:multidrug efflux system membrane fusion protein
VKRWLVAVLLVILVAAFVWWRHAGTAPAAGGKHGAGGPQAVGAAKAVAGPMAVTLDELGTVTPVATVTVLPQLSGYLTDVAFTEGQMVTKGQYLAEIDPRQYQILLEQDQGTLARDEAVLGQARSDLARYELLGRQKSISEQQVADQAFLVQQDEGTVKLDQANIDTANLDLAYCHITSPVDGRIGLRLVTVGNYVTSGSTTGIAVVTTVAPMSVIFSVAQADLAPVLVQMGQGASLTATAYSSDDSTKLAAGVLSAVDNQVNTSTGEVNLRAMFQNSDGSLFPNEFVNIHLLVNTLQNVTLVPSQAVQTGAPGSYVYIVNADNTVSVQKVTTGPTDGVNTVITDGVSPGDVVVTDGVDRLSDGAKVVATIAAPAAGSTAPAVTPRQHHHKHGKWNGGEGNSGGNASPAPAQ